MYVYIYIYIYIYEGIYLFCQSMYVGITLLHYVII